MSSASNRRRSRRSSERDSRPPPEFLIDRSLGRIAVPTALRAVSLTVFTLAEIYGEEQAQQTDDATWISYAATHGLVILCKDDWIRRRPLERAAVESGGARVFCLTNANLAFDEQAERFVRHRFRIIQHARRPGLYIYGVYEDGVRKLWPPEQAKATSGT
jgi:hypothetical protein